MKAIAHLAAAFTVLLTDWITGASRTEPGRYGPVVRFVTKHPWITAAALASGLGLGAATLVVSGVVPIRASSGHWPVTAWLLDFAKVQSVKTYSLGIDPPSLDDEALVVRGAAHYAVACEPCHGSPDMDVPAVMEAMTPPPPPLTGERLTRWTPAQLFSIVKHGIKFTGMPAWPVQRRDDEVWATIAFLRRLPQTSGAAYRTMAGRSPAAEGVMTPVATTGVVEAPAPVRTVCWRCHGADGTGRDGAFPSLAGQRAAYTHSALQAFANRGRFSATMADIAARLDEDAMREIAAYYEQLPARRSADEVSQPVRGASSGDAGAASGGAAIATEGVPDRDVPACIECHGPTDVPKNPAYPMLAGQHAPYLVQQLELLKQRRRGGSPRVNLMHAFVDRLTAEDIQQVARYYASLAPDGTR